MAFLQKTVNSVPFLMADGFGEGVVHGFSTRQGGVSEGIYASLNLGMSRGDDPARVAENFGLFCAAVGAAPEGLVCAAQVHGNTVRTCTRADAGKGFNRPVDYEADGLVTDVPGLTLVVFSADCLPILLYDPVRAVVAAAHAGWRGTALAIAGRTVEKMMDCYGCDPGNIRAAIGPGISACCFETHEDVPEAMTAALGETALDYIKSVGNGKFKVDTKGINALLLEQAGVRTEHIAVSGDCTVCSGERFWSHRVTGGVRGSMAAIISLHSKEL
ncbi:peptidoglycan editing factor PgeF [Aminipila butyrica]|uniref:Purine nucleoside phosphorylase n=1 Tax=Aminipila butyrica TaxID=433296 RepID=A0A858BRG5_9FIRM|nr:peptidoglycan editing factor PgeF [Aminipila butyrica]QIB67912.1 peptidoglycan editing factor PgeF [Aminipila butyrica]